MRYRPVGNWLIASVPAIMSYDPLDHVTFIVETLEPRSQAILELRSTRGFACRAWVNEARWEGILGYTIPSNSLTRLCRLCDDISFTVNMVDVPPNAD